MKTHNRITNAIKVDFYKYKVDKNGKIIVTEKIERHKKSKKKDGKK